MLGFSDYNLLTLFWYETLYTCDEMESVSLKSEHRYLEKYHKEINFEKVSQFFL